VINLNNIVDLAVIEPDLVGAWGNNGTWHIINWKSGKIEHSYDGNADFGRLKVYQNKHVLTGIKKDVVIWN